MPPTPHKIPPHDGDSSAAATGSYIPNASCCGLWTMPDSRCFERPPIRMYVIIIIIAEPIIFAAQGSENVPGRFFAASQAPRRNSGTDRPESQGRGVWGSPPPGEVWRGGTQNARETQRFWQGSCGKHHCQQCSSSVVAVFRTSQESAAGEGARTSRSVNK